MILCITGMPGSGKSIISDVAKSLGFRVVSMGDVIRKEAEARSMEITPASLGALMLELRKMEGQDALAKRCFADIRKGKAPVIVEGVRNPEELDYFKCSADILLIAVHASPATRFDRILKRARPDDPKDLATFRERDLRELKVGLGSVIAQADKMFLNEGTLEELQATAKKFFEGVRSGNKGTGRG